MRKLATMLVLMLTLGMVFSGAASAQEPAGTVDVAVLDENGDSVEVACLGEEVVIEANATPDGEFIDPTIVSLNIDPDTGMELVPEDAVMFFNGVMFENDDPIFGGFFAWNDVVEAWLWDIGFMDPNDFAQLYVPAIVTDVGPITVDAGLWTLDGPFPEGLVLLDIDSYTFLSVPCPCPHPPCGATVPMQATGSPLALAALGLLSIIGGAVYGKLR